MADKNNKLPDNVPGPWYVDSSCTPCRTCMEVGGVEAVLKYNEGETYVYFHKQPSTPEETTAAEEAAAVCPQNAIANDGE